VNNRAKFTNDREASLKKEHKLGFLDLGYNFIEAYRSFDITLISYLKFCKPFAHEKGRH
jgi:hypothetical protein